MEKIYTNIRDVTRYRKYIVLNLRLTTCMMNYPIRITLILKVKGWPKRKIRMRPNPALIYANRQKWTTSAVRRSESRNEY